MRTPTSEVDYTKRLDRYYDPRLVSSVRKVVHDSFRYYRQRAEEVRDEKPGLAEFARRVASNPDEIVYEIVRSDIRNPTEMRAYAKDAFNGRLMHAPSSRDSIAFCVDLYSREGEVTYEVGCGGSALTSTVIHEKVKDKEKIFLVDPKIFRPYFGKFSEHGTMVRSYVESFRVEDGKLVTDVIRNRGSMFKKMELPFADKIYIHDLLTFIEPDSKFNVSRIYQRGYSTRRDFAKGLRTILKDDGLLVIMNDVRGIERFRKDFGDIFRVEDRFSTSRVDFGSEWYAFGVGTFKPK